MKKQLLFILMVALSFGFSTAFGQVAPRPVTCLTPDALHPVAGTPYTYQVNVPTPPGTNSYTWIVTQDQTFVTAGALVATPSTIGGPILAAASGWYQTASTNDNISLTWQSFAYNPANPIFVVIFVSNSGSGAQPCTSQNVKVYKIEPLNSFTLDIANRNASMVTLGSDYGATIDRCISDIVDAHYDATAPEGVLYDFGVNYMYYEVVAANWSDAWNLSVQLSGIDPLEHVTVEWTKDGTYATGLNVMTGSAVGTGATPTVYTTATNITPNSGTFVGAGGESIFIRVTLDHSLAGIASWQGLVDENIVLAVDGVTVPATGTGVGDVHYQAGPGTPPVCPWVDLFANDIAYQVLKARPDILPVTPTPFLPVKP